MKKNDNWQGEERRKEPRHTLRWTRALFALAALFIVLSLIFSAVY